MKPSDLKIILSKHAEWLADNNKGERANLTSVNLRSADLTSADLSFADLSFADLTSADLSFADLSFANLSSADLSFADLSFANLSSALNLPDAPIVKDIDAKILAAATTKGCSLNMDNWHSCETSHCRAGWAVHLAGEDGYKLEKKTTPYLAGYLIYRASRPDISPPDFYASDKDAMADLVKCAK